MLLFESVQVGSMRVPNRIFMGALHQGYERDGYITQRIVDFYVERARGGAGLMSVGGMYVDRLGKGGAEFLAIDDDKYIPKLKELVDAVHRYDSRVACQLFHAGRYSRASALGEPAVSASAVPSRMTGETPRELSIGEIKELVKKYAQGALRAKRAGFDCVEVMASEGYLLNQFLSPLTNRRNDEYGGDLGRRMRLPLEIVQSIKGACGKSFPVVVRHSGADYMEGSTTFEEVKVIAVAFEEAGADCINVGVGWHESRVPTVYHSAPRGAFAYLARGIKEAVKVPVVASNRINDPRLAEEILRQGCADMVSMARPLIADPHLPRKAKSGRVDEINMCVACNVCLDTIFGVEGGESFCSINPEAGRERELKLRKTARAKRVAVIGGGPAGLEAARVMALRGHKVTLYEQGPRLGGQLLQGVTIPGKGEFYNFINYMARQMEKLQVDVRLNSKATPEMIQKGRFNAVVVASGIKPRVPEIPGVKSKKVVGYVDVLEGKAAVGSRVAIIGAGGVGCDVALKLAREGATSPDAAVYLAERGALRADEAVELTLKGREVTLMRRGKYIGDLIGRTTRWAVLQELSKVGVRMLTGVQYKEINESGVLIEREGKEELVPVDTVVLCAGQEPNDYLFRRLKGKVSEIHLIGGAKEAAELNCARAIYEGAIAGRRV